MDSTLLTATAYGRAVGLRVPSAEVDDTRGWLPWWWQDHEVQPEQVWEAESAAECETIVRWIELWVAEHAVDRIFVHAGVVYVNGSALLFPGRSFAGKSTLITALLACGATYGSDEYAVIAADGLVHPYPRPVTTREVDGSRTRTPVDPAQLGEAGPVSLVAHLRYEKDAELVLEPMPPGRSIVHLLDNTVAAQSRTEEALTYLSVAAGTASAVAGRRGSAKLAAAMLMELVG